MPRLFIKAKIGRFNSWYSGLLKNILIKVRDKGVDQPFKQH